MRLWALGTACLAFSVVGCGTTTASPGGFDASTVGDSSSPVRPDSAVPTVPDSGGSNVCVPKTCGELDAGCGPQGDTCGGIIDGGCGTCSGTQTCGGGGVPNHCGGGCTPKSCSAYPAGTCGAQADGCGGLTVNCNPCTDGGVCGGGGTSQCGPASAIGDAGVGDAACAPKTCLAGHCGPDTDGCGHSIDCGGCDGGSCGVPTSFVCGFPPDGAVDGGCVPETCGSQSIGCGPAGDGCGGILNCFPGDASACPSGTICDSVDGGPLACVSASSVCTKLTCAGQSIFCGAAGDGCGGTINCNPADAGGCPDSGTCETVDSGVVQCVGVATTCTATSCSKLGFNCGFTSDNCGGLLDCNGPGDAGCVAPEICGGGGPNLCGFGYSATDGGSSFVACAAGKATSITGIAYAATNPADFPAGDHVTPDPINGAYVWVPTDGTLPPIAPGVSCLTCGSPANALAYAITGPNGSFTLPNVPVTGSTVPLIVSVGRWARLIELPVTPCTANTVPEYDLRLPRNTSEGNIPWFAVDTGSVDSLECVLLKMGIDPTMWADPSTVISDMGSGGPVTGGTRVAVYTSPDYGDGQPLGGAWAPSGTNTSAADLYGDLPTMEQFDAVLFPCVAMQITKDFSGQIENVVDYANAGGRVFATHFSYVWLYDDWALAHSAGGVTSNDYGWGCGTSCATTNETIGKWDPDDQWDNGTGTISVSSTSGIDFAQWMLNVDPASVSSSSNPVTGASSVTFPIVYPRGDLLTVQGGAQAWDYADDSSGTGTNYVEQVTFNTPVDVAPANQCGKVVFSGFHVINTTLTYGGNPQNDFSTPFPAECTLNNTSTVTGNLPPMNAQERALEFMMFNLTSCVSTTSVTGTCTRKTCSSYPAGTCGNQSDGCGGFIACPTCPSGETCGAGGPSLCGTTCTKRTCSFYNTDAGVACGTQSDGCGGTLPCATCPAGETCGGGGVADVCGACAPKTCSDYPAGTCGEQANGCGGLTLYCNPCSSPATCGGAGSPGVCGVGTVCAPLSCLTQGISCGPAGDGCGNALPSCGSCPTGQTCGGGGVSGQCGGCVPLTCTSPTIGCGTNGDGCGGQISCPCPSGQTCGGGGTAGVCGSEQCVPTTCAALKIQCGYESDGCNTLLNCGTCPSGDTCTNGICVGGTPQ